MANSMRTLEYIRTYIDELLVITISTYVDHLEQVVVVLKCLGLAKLRIYVKKSNFALPEIEYL